MRWLYNVVTNESIFLTVVLSTVLIRCLTIFGDIKSRKSAMQMAAIQPQLDRIRKKYEKDPQRMSVEQRKIMKENNTSMFGGCLPMLITLPMFFVFIAAFRQWGQEMMAHLIVTMDADAEAGVELFKTFKFLWVNNMWAADNGMKPVVTAATEFFSKTNETLPRLLYFVDNPAALDTFVRLGFFVPDAASKYGYVLATASDSVVATYDALLAPCKALYAGYNNGWFLFPVIAGGSTFLSSWLTMKNQPKNDAANSTNSVMKWMMPAMSVFFCLTSNAAFALYWTASNIISTITTLIINRSFAKKYPPAEVEVK